MDFERAVAWISTVVAVIIGMKITKSPWCLWAFYCLYGWVKKDITNYNAEIKLINI